MTRGSVALSATLACVAIHACTPDFGELNSGGEGGAPGLGGSTGAVAGASGTGGNARGGSGGAGAVGGSSGAATGNAGAPEGGASEAGGNAGDGPTSAGAGAGGAPQGGSAGGWPGRPGQSRWVAKAAPPNGRSAPALANALFYGPRLYVSAARRIQDSFTIEAWIKLTASLQGTYFYQGSPILWADVSGDAPDFGLSVLNNKLVMNIGLPETAATSTSIVATGQWVHVAATRSRATGLVELYVNGQRETTVTGNKLSLAASALMSVGTVERRDLHLNGAMDELKLWATVRTQAEIRAGMRMPPREEEPGLVGYYRFDEAVPTRLTDSSHERNHGTITGNIAVVVSGAPLCTEGGDAGAGGAGGAGGNAGAAADAGADGNAGAASESGAGGTLG